MSITLIVGALALPVAAVVWLWCGLVTLVEDRDV